MISLKINVNGVKRAEAVLHGFKNLPNDLKEFYFSVRDICRNAFWENFEKQKFAPLAIATQKERKYKGYPPDAPILIRTGDLRDVTTGKKGLTSELANITQIDKKSAMFGVAGGKAVGLNNGITNRGVIPKREFIKLDNKDFNKISISLRDYMRKYWKKCGGD